MSLVDDIRSGSSDAIKQLYQENAQDIYDFAKGITNDHDTAMQATKNTLSRLVEQIQNGDDPANLHSEALKLAYDEARKFTASSVQNIKSPYDDEEEAAELPPSRKPRREEAPERPQREQPKKNAYAEQYDDGYDNGYDNWSEPEPAPAPPRRPPQKGNRQSSDARQRQQAQAPRRNPRQEAYYEDERYGRQYDRYDDYDDGYDDYDVRPKHGAGFWVCLVINIILVLLLIWFLVGLLMNLGVIPDTLHKTLGFEWFNQTIYPLF